MAVSQAQKLAKAKYQQASRTLIAADVSKVKGDLYRQSAKELNLSLSMLIQNGIDEYLQNHFGEEFVPLPTTTPENKLSADDRRLLDSAGKLTPEARKQLVKFLEILTARAATLDTKGGDENGDN